MLWYQGGILFLIGAIVAMGAGFRRMIGRYRTPTGDMLLAGAVVVLVFSVGSTEMLNRWLWLPFVLALAIRHPAVTNGTHTSSGPPSAQGANRSVQAPARPGRVSP
jgi:hypothetical protein